VGGPATRIPKTGDSVDIGEAVAGGDGRNGERAVVAGHAHTADTDLLSDHEVMVRRGRDGYYISRLPRPGDGTALQVESARADLVEIARASDGTCEGQRGPSVNVDAGCTAQNDVVGPRVGDAGAREQVAQSTAAVGAGAVEGDGAPDVHAGA